MPTSHALPRCLSTTVVICAGVLSISVTCGQPPVPPSAASPPAAATPPVAATPPAAVAESASQDPQAVSKQIRSLSSELLATELKMSLSPTVENHVLLAQVREKLSRAKLQMELLTNWRGDIEIHSDAGLTVYARLRVCNEFVALPPATKRDRRSTAIGTIAFPCEIDIWCVDDTDAVVAKDLKLTLHSPGEVFVYSGGAAPTADPADQPFPAVVESQGVGVRFVPDTRDRHYQTIRQRHAELRAASRQLKQLEATQTNARKAVNERSTPPAAGL